MCRAAENMNPESCRTAGSTTVLFVIKKRSTGEKKIIIIGTKHVSQYPTLFVPEAKCGWGGVEWGFTNDTQRCDKGPLAISSFPPFF